MHMKIERRWKLMTQILGAMLISVVLLAGCGGSSQSAGSASDASSVAAVTPPASAGTGSTNVTLSWSAPTENTNGSALTNLAGYIIYYGTSASAMTQTIDINTVGMLTYVVDNLSAGSWYFQIVAVNSAGEQSGPSATVSASI
jgi:ABC-type glycerol-3-phosphate transport system substrate-binding protein